QLSDEAVEGRVQTGEARLARRIDGLRRARGFRWFLCVLERPKLGARLAPGQRVPARDRRTLSARDPLCRRGIAGCDGYDSMTGAPLRVWPFVIREQLIDSLRAALAEAGFEEPASGI